MIECTQIKEISDLNTNERIAFIRELSFTIELYHTKNTDQSHFLH